jgi:hypothetical protein
MVNLDENLKIQIQKYAKLQHKDTEEHLHLHNQSHIYIYNTFSHTFIHTFIPLKGLRSRFLHPLSHSS